MFMLLEEWTAPFFPKRLRLTYFHTIPVRWAYILFTWIIAAALPFFGDGAYGLCHLFSVASLFCLCPARTRMLGLPRIIGESCSRRVGGCMQPYGDRNTNCCTTLSRFDVLYVYGLLCGSAPAF